MTFYKLRGRTRLFMPRLLRTTEQLLPCLLAPRQLSACKSYNRHLEFNVFKRTLMNVGHGSRRLIFLFAVVSIQRHRLDILLRAL